MKAENVEDERVSTRKYFWMTGTKRGTKQNKYLEDQDFYASFPWLANWKSLDCNNNEAKAKGFDFKPKNPGAKSEKQPDYEDTWR